MAVGTLWSVTLDCDDPETLGAFWAAMLDGEVGFSNENFVGVTLPNGVWIGAYKVPDYQPATWPDGDTGKQFHLDISVVDLDEAVDAAVALGATTAGHQPEPDRWRVLLDPAGHPFCVTNQAPA